MAVNLQDFKNIVQSNRHDYVHLDGEGQAQGVSRSWLGRKFQAILRFFGEGDRTANEGVVDAFKQAVQESDDYQHLGEMKDTILRRELGHLEGGKPLSKQRIRRVFTALNKEVQNLQKKGGEFGLDLNEEKEIPKEDILVKEKEITLSKPKDVQSQEVPKTKEVQQQANPYTVWYGMFPMMLLPNKLDDTDREMLDIFSTIYPNNSEKQNFDLLSGLSHALAVNMVAKKDIEFILQQGLTKKEICCLFLYTKGPREISAPLMNKTLWGVDKNSLDLGPLGPIIKGAVSALDKLPDYKSENNSTIVYRRLISKNDLDPSEAMQRYDPHAENPVVVEKGFLSTSYEKLSSGTQYYMPHTQEEMDQFTGHGFIITSKHGKKIDVLSGFSQEKEVLFKPCTEFRVTGKTVTNGGGILVHMEEVDPQQQV